MNAKIFLTAMFILTLGFASASGVCRDVNSDGNINELDVDSMINYAFNGYDIPAEVNADLNNDGIAADVFDVISLINCVYRNKSMLTSDCPGCVIPNDLGDNMHDTIFDSGEKTLQSILNDNGYNINVNDQTNAQVWEVVQNAKIEVTFIGGISSYPHAFGYYNKGDLNSFVPLFQDFEYLKYAVPVAQPGDKFTINLEKGDEIGFAMDSKGTFNDSGTLATENDLNDPKRDQALVFQEGNEFVIGFEDTFRDFDFQDMIISVKVVECEPSESYCGDGTVQEDKGEFCDDGNNVDGDGCNAQCDWEFCDDGILQPGLGEECDEGEGNTLNGCYGDVTSYCEYQTCKVIQCQPTNITCSSNSDCGTDFYSDNFCSANSVVKNQTSFTCHNPGTQDSYCSSSTNEVFVQECSHMCMDGMCHEPNMTCGNGITECTEQCDQGANNGIVCNASYGGSCNYCSNTCESINVFGPYCGDHAVNGPEFCDDGNNINGDGCSSLCFIEQQQPVCGNGVVEGNETCDTGISNGIVCDNSNQDCTYCSSTCQTVQRLERNHNDNNNHDEFQIADFMMSTCNPNWQCTGWTECLDGVSTRVCQDTNNCGLIYNKPFEQTSCEALKSVLIEKEKSSFPFWLLILLAIFVVLIIISIVNWR